jgi:ribosomal protein L21E
LVSCVEKGVQEEYGAGFEGTDALRDKYIKDTPGQHIQQFKTEMKDSKEISQIKNEFDMELIPQSKWAKNYQTNVRKVKQLYGISQGNGEYDDVYFVIYDDENKPYGVVDIEGTSMYAKFSDAKAGLKFALNSMEESLQEAVSKIDVEELLDAAAKMRKEFPQLRKGQSIMLTLHNMNPTMYSMAAAKHDAFTVDAKIPDLINFLDPKYYAESANLDEAMDPQNTSYGYYGTVDVEKYKLIAYKKMADKVLKIARAKKIFANYPNTSNSDQESAVVKYLDSKHGRHIADGNDSPAYIEKDFTRFLKDFAAGHYMESVDLEEAVLKVGTFVTLSNGKVGKVTNVSGDKEIVDIKLNDGRQVSVTMDKVISSMSEAFNIRDYNATSEKSQFGGYRPKVVRKDGTVLYLSAASYITPDEAKDHAEEYLKQYSRGISEPKVPGKGTYPTLKEEISLDQRRQMKIVALATGSTDLDKIYEYVTTQPVQYSSIVELKENFNNYIQSL